MVGNKTVLVLYQGEESRSRLDSILAKLSQALPPFQVQPLKLGSGENSFERSILAKLVDYINRSDAAVALVSLDERLASKEAGNLWFEIGLWYGIKSPANLLVLMQKHEDVVLPSDVLGQIVPRVDFENDATIEYEISRFLNNIFKKPEENDEYDCPDKIRDTLLGINGGSLEIEDLFMCDNATPGACSNKKALFCFTSELLRLGKNGWEHNSIQYALLEICRLSNCLELAHIRRASCGRDQKHDVEQTIGKFNMDLFNVVRYIEDFAGKYLQRSRGNDYSSWEKFKAFLSYRLEVAKDAYNPRDFPLENHAVFPAMARRLPEFVEWAEHFSRNSDQYDLRHSADPGYDARLVRAKESGGFAHDMAVVLFGIGEWNFDNSYKMFKTEFERITNKAIVPSVLMGLTKKLPHAGDKRAPKIWPRRP